MAFENIEVVKGYLRTDRKNTTVHNSGTYGRTFSKLRKYTRKIQNGSDGFGRHKFVVHNRHYPFDRFMKLTLIFLRNAKIAREIEFWANIFR